MKKVFTIFCFVIFIPWHGKAQVNNLPKDQQRLLLELSSGYYNVASIGQINLDSSLIAASSYLKMSRTPVILEGFENEFKGQNITWIDKRDPSLAKKELSGLKGLDRLKLTLLIGAYYSFQSGKDESDADSALAYLFKARQQCEVLHSTFWLNQTSILISKAYLKQNNIQKAEEFTNLVIQNSKSPLDLRTQAKANYYYGTYCPFITELTKGRISRLQTASGIYHRLNDHIGEIISHTYHGYLNGALGNYQQANQSARSAIRLEKSIQFPFTQYNKDQIAMYDGYTLDYIEMLTYAEQAIDDVKNTKEDFGLSIIYERMALAYEGNDYSNPVTEYWQRKAIEEAMRNPNFYTGYSPLLKLTFKMIAKKQVAEALRLIKRYLAEFPPHMASEKMLIQETIGNCYVALRNYPAAEKYFQDAVSLAKDPSNASNPNVVFAYVDLGYFYIETKKYEQARPLFIVCLNLPTHDDDLTYSIEKSLSTIDSAAGNFASAYVHLQKYAVLQEKTFDKRGVTERARLETRFETKEKEQSIRLLETKAKADRAELKQIGLQRNVTFGGVLALVLVSALVYNGYRNKKRSNLLLNAQQREINEKNASLEKTLTEKDHLLSDKDLLLKEVNHRVKNNLHIVMSLLDSQSAYLNNNAAIAAIQDSQNRVHSIALIHQKLYSSENITQVDMESYIPELIDYLNESINGTDSSIVISHNIEPILLDVAQAIPVGIILNEAITNSIKYSFPNNRKGEISVKMSSANDVIYLEIADNGAGLPADFDITKAKSLGMNLIKGLTNQLKGNFDISSKNGVCISIKFSKEIINA